MTDLLGLLAYLVLPLVGLVVWRLDFIREMPLGARLGVAMAAGSLIVALLMSSLSVIGIEWSRTVLFAILALVGFLGFLGVPRAPRVARISAEEPEELRGTPRNRHGWWRPADAGTAFCWLLTLYGTLTARHSCGDLQFTWGPKAVRWFRAGGLDPDVLHTWPQLTVDYPPLQTLLLALSNTFARQFPWWAAVLASPLFLLALLAVLRVWSRDALGTLLAAATLTYTYTLAYPAGCAEPPLLLFEAIAIGALTFVGDVENGRAQTFLAALGVAGAVFTKLEGATFAVAVFLTILLVQRKPRRAFLVIAPGALLFAAWMTFVFRNDLLYMYGGAKMPIYWSTIPVVLKTLAKVAKFNLWWLPYLVPIVLIAIGNVRRALVPVAIALLTTGATVYFYVHYPDPVWWIESSSPRVILTPLLALLIGVMAARPYARVARHGVVPEGKETEGGGRPPGGDPRGALGQV